MNIKQFILHSLYPSKCPGCGEIIPYDRLFCEVCIEDMTEPTGALCKVCLTEKKFCDCHKNPKWFKACCAPFYYEGAAASAVISLKDYENKRLADYFAQIMSEKINNQFKDVEFDVIVPVPMHPEKFRKRGYNQSELLARALSDKMNIPMDNTILTQVKKNKRQHTLNHKLRRENVQDIYQLMPFDTKYKNILLVDDIITTGFTLSECAKMFVLSGIKSVYAVGVAKNRINHDK